jgi:hypothetical protein
MSTLKGFFVSFVVLGAFSVFLLLVTNRSEEEERRKREEEERRKREDEERRKRELEGEIASLTFESANPCFANLFARAVELDIVINKTFFFLSVLEK